MARRVNKKFVIILSAGMVGAVGLVGGVKLYRWQQQQDPDLARVRGEAAEKSGDLKTAALEFQRAGMLMSQKHQSRADLLLARSAELCMKISREAKTQDDAVTFFQRAMGNYRLALQENPRNREVSETLAEESYQNARYFPSMDSWQAVVDVADKLIVNHDGAKSRLYRAEARLRMAMNSFESATSRSIEPVEADLAAAQASAVQAIRDAKEKSDLTAAQALQVQLGNVVALRGELMWFRARLSAHQRKLTRTDELLADASYQQEIAATRQLLINCLEGQWQAASPGWAWLTRISLQEVNANVAATLASMTMEQFQLSGGRDPAKVELAIRLLEAAFKADPNQTVLAERLGTLYMGTRRAEKAEELFKQIIERTPEKPEAYIRLAAYYRERAEQAKAIEAYREVTRHPLIGVGRDAVVNAQYQRDAVDGIAWLSMELAEKPGTTPEQAKTLLKDAAEATERLKALNAPVGMINLLDGRAQFIERNYPNAAKTLKLAEADLAGRPGQAERYRQTELLLARVNQELRQFGAALEKWNRALGMRPTDINVILGRAELQMRLSRPEDVEDVRLAMGRLLGEKDGQFTNEDNLPPVVADAAKQLWAMATQAIRKDPRAMAQLRGTLQGVLIAMNEQEFAEAAANAEEFLRKPDISPAESAKAYEAAIISQVQLKNDAATARLLADALARHPGNGTFQVYKAQMDNPEAIKTLEGRKKIIESITDEYSRALSLASLYRGEKLWDEEIAVLQKAREAYRNPTTQDGRERLASLLDRLFVAALSGAGSNTEAKQDPYWKLGQSVVTEMEKLNFDGAEGKLYMGRLEMTRSGGKSGLQYLQQAVAQQPDYAQAHLILGQAYFSLMTVNAATGAATNYANLALEEFRQAIRLAPNNLLALQYAIELLVRRGDSVSMTEAQGLLESALAMSPHNPRFVVYQEILMANVEEAIKSRKAIFERQPEDRNNLRRLAGLYVRLKDKVPDPDKKQEAMDNALKLLEADYLKNKTELGAGDTLARMLVELDKSEKGAMRALDIYAEFIASPDPTVKFNALISKAEFFRSLLLRPEAIKALVDAKRISRENPREEAVDVLLEAIKIEPKEQDDAERHLADMYFELDRMADAEKVYLQVLAKNTSVQSADRVTRRLIETLVRQRKYKEAEPLLAALLAKQPQDIQGLVLRAYSHIQQGLNQPLAEQAKALKVALDDLNQVLKNDDGNPDALFYRAMAQMMLGDRMDEAERDLIQASRRRPGAVNIRQMLAQLYVRTQRYEESSREYREILRQHPDAMQVRVEYIGLLKNLAELQLTLPKDSDAPFVQTLRRLGPLERFMEEVTTASERYPGVRWFFLHAQGLAMQGKEADAQERLKRLYEELRKQGVIDAETSDAYLGSLLKTRTYAEVVRLSTEIIDTNPDFIPNNPQYVSFFLKRARAQDGLGKSEEAVKDIDRALAIGVAAISKSGNMGPFVTVLSNLAEASATTGSAATPTLSPELAAQRLRARLAADPNETISKIGLIQLLLTQNKAAEALNIVETLNTSEKDPSLRLLVLRQSALVRYQAKQYAAAEKDFNELEKLLPGNIENLNNYAFLLAEGLKRPQEAIAKAEQALKLLSTRSDPGLVTATLASLKDTLGWAYYLNGNTSNAIANLQESVKVQPQASAYYHLSRAYQKDGKKDEARATCQEGIKLATVRHETETLTDLRALEAELK